MACELAHLEAKRLSVNPMAVGQIPPDILFSAISQLPKKMEATSVGQRPASIKLIKPVSDVKKI